MTTPYCGTCSQACAFCHGTYAKLRAENECLRTAIKKLRVTLSDVQTYAGAALAYPVPGQSEGDGT